MENIQLRSDSTVAAVEEFTKKQPNFEREFGPFDAKLKIEASYLYWYRYRSPTALCGLTAESHDMMKLLTSWIEDNYGELYNRVQEQSAKNLVSPETVQFLIQPGDVIVWKEKKELISRCQGPIMAQTFVPARFGSDEQGNPGDDTQGRQRHGYRHAYMVMDP